MNDPEHHVAQNETRHHVREGSIHVEEDDMVGGGGDQRGLQRCEGRKEEEDGGAVADVVRRVKMRWVATDK